MAPHCLALATTLYPRKTIIPRATLQRESKMRVPYELKQGQYRLFHQLPSGLKMEVIYQKGVELTDPVGKKECLNLNPPLVFIHGSFHAAWCWAEHWLPFFSTHGYDCYALSLLGQGESDEPSGPVAGSLETHAGNVADFIRKETKFPPVLLGHSFGGLIVQYYIANTQSRQLTGTEIMSLHPNLHGAVLLCSVPPSGNRYQKLMTESSRLPLFDLRKLNASLPVPVARDPSLQILVLGANDDFIVDAKGVGETGIFYGVEPVCIEEVAHDMMLDISWEKGAEYILQWLNDLKMVETK
ncbi:hypothetical protein DCAR_0519652 [Daucus carota subsp. sativus]|uniref:Uncharacterized protein n=1 Tax=Daucus carota subsp. sativus TaxID=79200 RepID=A0A164Y425_DAUCS|nr:hypothetical protein DCAR_0519652 [Daucus carota subsp. sativus]